MKKIIIITILIFIMTGCGFYNQKKHLSNVLEIDVNNCVMERIRDTHGGFLGDGETFMKLDCSDMDDEKIVNKWNKMPIDPDIHKALSIKKCDDDGCFDVYERLEIPMIEKGYYYFLDRYEYSDKYEKSINDRSAYNMSLAMYDENKKMLYYYELDT